MCIKTRQLATTSRSNLVNGARISALNETCILHITMELVNTPTNNLTASIYSLVNGFYIMVSNSHLFIPTLDVQKVSLSHLAMHTCLDIPWIPQKYH